MILKVLRVLLVEVGVTADTIVTATFNPTPLYTLTITKDGTGTGTINNSTGVIDCGENCTGPIFQGTLITLTATPNTGSIFTGWSGNADCGDGSVIITKDIVCTATFVLAPITQQYTLTVVKSGSGTGTIKSSQGEINCGTDCTELIDENVTVNLVATPDTGFIFVGWSVDECPGTGDCTITIRADTTISATFNSDIGGADISVNEDSSSTTTGGFCFISIATY